VPNRLIWWRDWEMAQKGWFWAHAAIALMSFSVAANSRVGSAAVLRSERD